MLVLFKLYWLTKIAANIYSIITAIMNIYQLFN
nr:MAG TPA: hypothetical protein [Caudoviricetes sp.]